MLSQLTKDLCLELQKGKFCYVTGPRPINRPSLCQHTCLEMAQRGYRNVVVSIQPWRDTAQAQRSWEQHIISSVWNTLHPDNPTQLSRWLATTAHLSPMERLNQFTSDLLLSDLCDGPFLICLDNIDDLFNISGALRGILNWITYCYELRDTYLTYRHLSIAVFGSVKPAFLHFKNHFAAAIEQPVFFQVSSNSTEPGDSKQQMSITQHFSGRSLSPSVFNPPTFNLCLAALG